MKTLALFAIFSAALFAQSNHSATLTWSDTTNPAGTTYNVYRATGACAAGLTFTDIAPGVAVKTYVDSTVTPGVYCYQVTAVLNGVESAPSNQAGAPVPPNAPSLTVVVK